MRACTPSVLAQMVLLNGGQSGMDKVSSRGAHILESGLEVC